MNMTAVKVQNIRRQTPLLFKAHCFPEGTPAIYTFYIQILHPFFLYHVVICSHSSAMKYKLRNGFAHHEKFSHNIFKVHRLYFVLNLRHS